MPVGLLLPTLRGEYHENSFEIKLVDLVIGRVGLPVESVSRIKWFQQVQTSLLELELIAKLNLVILHYHLNRGGVTSVIRNQIQAIVDDGPGIQKILVLHGPGTDGWADGEIPIGSHANDGDGGRKTMSWRKNGPLSPWIEFKELEALGYQDNGSADPKLAQTISSVLRGNRFGREETIIHVHNHNLGKNNFLLPAISTLADQGYRLLLQIHDFAEDLRPENYARIKRFCRENQLPVTETVYPSDPRILYACLNRRDQNLLREFRGPAARCQLLPNPVCLEQPQDCMDLDGTKRTIGNALKLDIDKPIVLYPVRAIRRKNIAEAILFSAVYRDVQLLITLPAKSPEETPQYLANRTLAKELDLPVIFEAGLQGVTFSDLVSVADRILTTSVAEGFGMVFLECWLQGKTLIGRNLPSITGDFVEQGLDLSGLYERVAIPADWISVQEEIQAQQQLLNKIASQFELSEIPQIQHLGFNDCQLVDFGRLRHRTQTQIIRKVRYKPGLTTEITRLNPRFSLGQNCPDRLKHNARIVQENYSAHSFAARYRKVVAMLMQDSLESTSRNSSVLGQDSLPDFLIKRFLDADNFFPVRLESE